ncbi:MAG: RHS repeat protein [Candidatus Thermoplasmatota archaeon]|nr:RHS repeat protein [Candidatus Thermoplasmatota archaeon]
MTCILSVTDALAKTTTYAYDPFGNPFYVLNPGGALESLTEDADPQ